jgi:chromosome segregation ATPase
MFHHREWMLQDGDESTSTLEAECDRATSIPGLFLVQPAAALLRSQDSLDDLSSSQILLHSQSAQTEVALRNKIARLRRENKQLETDRSGPDGVISRGSSSDVVLTRKLERQNADLSAAVDTLRDELDALAESKRVAAEEHTAQILQTKLDSARSSALSPNGDAHMARKLAEFSAELNSVKQQAAQDRTQYKEQLQTYGRDTQQSQAYAARVETELDSVLKQLDRGVTKKGQIAVSAEAKAKTMQREVNKWKAEAQAWKSESSTLQKTLGEALAEAKRLSSRLESLGDVDTPSPTFASWMTAWTYPVGKEGKEGVSSLPTGLASSYESPPSAAAAPGAFIGGSGAYKRN